MCLVLHGALLITNKGVFMKQDILIKAIRKIVKEEVSKAIKIAVNEVLAEHFVRVMAERQTTSNLTEVFHETSSVASVAQQKRKPSAEDLERQRFEARKKLLERTADGNPMMKMAMEDMDVSDLKEERRARIPGEYVDDDDEGVDISGFGF